MKIIGSTVYEGRNIHSHKKCIVLDVDLEGYSEIPSKDRKINKITSNITYS